VLPIIYEGVGIASISIPDCMEISDPKYLVVRCNISDLSNNTLSNNCTYTCSNLEPGSIYTASLIRLPIPIADENDHAFDEESINETYRIGEYEYIFTLLSVKVVFLDLDKVTNFIFRDNAADKKMVWIYFTPPRGNYDKIQLSCTAFDQYCPSGSTYLVNSTGNCSSCNFIQMSPIIRGVEYWCQATTIKEFFTDVISDPLNFNTRK
jgi:hypothetical protein